MNYAPIHNHSEYSALDGLSTCREIAVRCQEIGCECCGLTDHGTASGHLEFAKVMQEHGIKPIFGCELYHGTKTTFGKNERDQAHFVAGAMTDEGLRNVWRMIDSASDNFRFVGRVNWDILKNNSKGVFATSACIQGLVGQGVLKGDPYEPLNRYLEIFKDDFYVEIHTYPGEEHERLNTELVQIAQERGIPLIYATDAHFASPEQYAVHDAYVASQTGEDVMMDTDKRKMWHPKALYIMSEPEIRESLSYLPESAVDEALRNSGELADKCNASLPEVRRHLPAFIPKDCPWMSEEDQKEDASKIFIDLVEQGIINRYGNNPDQEVWDRAEQELGVFLDAGLEHYFLQAWDFCQFCDKNGIKRGPGRGSAAGAIVAYALGITDIDPIQYELIFERFYNPGREKGFPDIDNDFPVKERKRVREYLMDRWGHNRVRTIGTITRMKPKAAIDKTHKACCVTFEEKEALKRIIDQVVDIDALGPDAIGWDEEIDPGKVVYVMNPETEIPKMIEDWLKTLGNRRDVVEYWIEIVRHVCSRVSGYGVHPSGVVVSDVSLQDELPCLWNASQQVHVTCFPMSDVDKRMFVKQDLLGLRNLDTLQDWEDQVSPQVGDIDWSGLTNKDLEEGGWNLLDVGLTLGIFQIEKGYARQLCKEFKPRSIEDIGIIVALNRPGPIGSGAPDSFIARRCGEEEVAYDHPILESILEPTYGWFLYQEQVIAFFSKLGYSLGDADAVRKILGKKMPQQMKALKDGRGEWSGKGYFAMAESAGIDPTSAGKIWGRIEDFARYSFNKSHAIAYATIAFRTLYAKYNAPAQFIMACIRTNPDEAGGYVGEGRRMGVKVLTPDIIHSQTDVAVVENDIYFGFSNVKGIGRQSAQFLCDLRDKYDLSTPESLSDAIEREQDGWESARDEAKLEGKSFKSKSPRQQFRQNLIPLLEKAGAWENYEDRDITLIERQKLEKELLGVILTDNCDEIFTKNIDDLDNCDSYANLELSEGDKVRVPGAVSSVVNKKTKKDGTAMGIVTIEYHGDSAEFVVFPREWQTYKFLWKERTPAIFTLSKSDRGIRFEDAIKLS